MAAHKNTQELYNSFFSFSRAGFNLASSEEEEILTSVVHAITTNELRIQSFTSTTSAPNSFDLRVRDIRRNLKNILELFGKASKSRVNFVECFPDWFTIRQKNITELKEVADSIHSDRLNSNISRLVGSSVGITGGAALVGCLLFPPAAAVVLPLSIGGGVAAALGGATVFGTSATEIALLNRKMHSAREVLIKDQQSFMSMMEWFDHAMALVDAIEDMIGFQFMKSLAEDSKRVLKTFTISNPNFEAHVRYCVRRICADRYRLVLHLGPDLAAIVITFCIVVILMHKQNFFILQCVFMTHLLVFELLSEISIGEEVSRSLAMAVRGSTAAVGLSTSIGKVALQGLFAGIGIALDVTNIVLTSIDIHKGSNSRQEKNILKAVEKLQEEITFLAVIYNQLKQEQNLIRAIKG